MYKPSKLTKDKYFNHTERRKEVAVIQGNIEMRIKSKCPIDTGVYDYLLNPYLLLQGFNDCVNFRKASGVDGIKFGDYCNSRNARSFVDLNPNKVMNLINGLIEELRTDSYEHKPLRKTVINTGKERAIYIPCIRDRIVQRAVSLLINQTIFDPSFYSSSHAYRHNMGTKGAILQLEQHILSGKTAVIDADIRKFFDNIPHKLVLDCFRKKVTDENMVGLIEKFITAPIKDKEEIITLSKGCHQGSLISPLLSNIVLHELDKHFYSKGLPSKYDARIVRYADDLVVLTEGRVPNELFEYLGDVLSGMGFELHPEKTKIVDLLEPKERLRFLGFEINIKNKYATTESLPNGFISLIRPNPKKVEKLKTRVDDVITTYSSDKEKGEGWLVKSLNAIISNFNHDSGMICTERKLRTDLNRFLAERLKKNGIDIKGLYSLSRFEIAIRPISSDRTIYSPY